MEIIIIKTESSITKDFRTELKGMEFKSEKISVRKNVYVEQIVNKYKGIDYCQKAEEILVGNITYIFSDKNVIRCKKGFSYQVFKTYYTRW